LDTFDLAVQDSLGIVSVAVGITGIPLNPRLAAGEGKKSRIKMKVRIKRRMKRKIRMATDGMSPNLPLHLPLNPNLHLTLTH
jgi:hypothetical protein